MIGTGGLSGDEGTLKIVAESRTEVVFGGLAGLAGDAGRFQEAHAKRPSSATFFMDLGALWTRASWTSPL